MLDPQAGGTSVQRGGGSGPVPEQGCTQIATLISLTPSLGLRASYMPIATRAISCSYVGATCATSRSTVVGDPFHDALTLNEQPVAALGSPLPLGSARLADAAARGAGGSGGAGRQRFTRPLGPRARGDAS